MKPCRDRKLIGSNLPLQQLTVKEKGYLICSISIPSNSIRPHNNSPNHPIFLLEQSTRHGIGNQRRRNFSMNKFIRSQSGSLIVRPRLRTKHMFQLPGRTKRPYHAQRSTVPGGGEGPGITMCKDFEFRERRVSIDEPFSAMVTDSVV